jgi:endonuclease YncB( thermonuclease family)
LPRRYGHWILIIVGTLLAARLGYWARSTAREFDFTSAGPFHVVRVVDDRSLLLDGDITVRLLGIRSAERNQADSANATDLLRRRVEGRDVTIELDRERRDGDGRILAYVYADDSLLNEELILAGFSRAEASFNINNAMATRFRRAEANAREAERGIWQTEAVTAR